MKRDILKLKNEDLPYLLLLLLYYKFKKSISIFKVIFFFSTFFFGDKLSTEYFWYESETFCMVSGFWKVKRTCRVLTSLLRNAHPSVYWTVSAHRLFCSGHICWCVISSFRSDSLVDQLVKQGVSSSLLFWFDSTRQ